jgi:hypothetical protein
VNEVGELRIKGDGVMKGYLGKEMCKNTICPLSRFDHSVCAGQLP